MIEIFLNEGANIEAEGYDKGDRCTPLIIGKFSNTEFNFGY
jgi:hypothetical protein